jgi:hypothetical protein
MEVDRDTAYDQAEGAVQDEEEYSEFLTSKFDRPGRTSYLHLQLTFPFFPVTSSGESSSQTSTLTWIVCIEHDIARASVDIFTSRRPGLRHCLDMTTIAKWKSLTLRMTLT